MNNEDKILLNEQNIRQAISDYRKHTRQYSVLDDVSDEFIERLAKDNYFAKMELRELFRKSPVWNEELDALIINGTRTHQPDYDRVEGLANDILFPACYNVSYDFTKLVERAITFFSKPDNDPTAAIEAIKEISPNAYAPRKKRSRIFKAICDSLNVTDDSAGSRFQKLYAQFADELSSKKIDFKLFVSLNPAHFITMSNPKDDRRGDTLTSCHSFNSTSYSYNNGCSGYARDDYSFITFIAANPNEPETLNNRKIMRQMFAYKVNNGLLLQSRLYNTSGGTYGAQKESKLYRDLVQREISDLEDAPNLWKTIKYFNNSKCVINIGDGFGGYPDWIYKDFDAKISIRNDHADDFKEFAVGTNGLCIACGDEIESKLYCYDCAPNNSDDDDESEQCDDCEGYFHDTYAVYNCDGEEIYVCADCRNRYYAYCEECDRYYPRENVRTTEDGSRICDNCLEHMKEGAVA